MKKLISLLLCVLLLAGCKAEVYEGPTEISCVITQSLCTIYDTYSGQSSTRLHADSYDSFGNLVCSLYYSDGELTSEHRFSYDARGNRIRETNWDHTGLISLPISRTDYTYDDRGRVLTTTYRNGLGFKTGGDTFTYDDEANTIFWNGTYDTQTRYLNENGDLIRVVTFSEPAGMEIETLYEYDELGRNTKITEYRNGALASITQKRYDDQGRILENISCDANGTAIYGTTCVYDENTVTTVNLDGNRSVETLRPDGLVETMDNFDPDGNLLSRTEYSYRQINVPKK
ncbi:MAG: hypothetical protein IKU31_02930 [Oscillospiraceae bacterium]|nr:hypothetical protein [Oscillospiraceae bacterium]